MLGGGIIAVIRAVVTRLDDHVTGLDNVLMFDIQGRRRRMYDHSLNSLASSRLSFIYHHLDGVIQDSCSSSMDCVSLRKLSG